MQVVKEARYLSNKLTDTDIIKLSINNFTFEVKRSILNSGLKTVDEIEEHLRELDSAFEDGGRRIGNGETGWRRQESSNNGFVRNEQNRIQHDVIANRGQGLNNKNNVAVNNNEKNNRERGQPTNSIAILFNVGGEELLVEEERQGRGLVKEMLIVVGRVERVKSSILVDLGSQVSCVSGQFIKVLQQSNAKIPLLLVNSTTLIGAIGKGKQTVSKQVFLKVEIDDANFDVVFLVVPALARNIILGCDW